MSNEYANDRLTVVQHRQKILLRSNNKNIKGRMHQCGSKLIQSHWVLDKQTAT